MEKNIMDYPYEHKDIIIDNESVKLLELVNPRQTRSAQVNSLLRSLKKDEHFDSLFVVNVNNGVKKIRVIDGGHRTQAMRKFFDLFPDKKIKVSMAVYKDLNEHEERMVYTKWNIGVKQTIDDFINSYKVEIPEFDNIIERLPVSVYGSKNKMKIRFVVDAYLSAKQCPFTGGMSYDRVGWLEAFSKLEWDDVQSMKETFKLFKEIFNPNDTVDFTRLSAFKYSNFKALYRLVHTNKVLLGKNYVIKKMSRVLYNSSLLDRNRNLTNVGTVEIFNIYKQLLNKNTAKKFQ